MEITRLGSVGAEVQDVQPEALSAPDKRRLSEAFDAYGLLVIRGLALSPESQIELTRALGEPEIHPVKEIRMDGYPEIILLNAKAKEAESFAADDPLGDQIIGRLPWHSDLTFTVKPARGALLYAVEVPPLMGQTGFADRIAAYDAVPNPLKRQLPELKVVHSVDSVSYGVGEKGKDSGAAKSAQYPPVVHPLVFQHPRNGRTVLNISPLFTQYIVGMEPEKGSALLAELEAISTRAEYVYVHDWKVGDLVVWDNLRMMHRAMGWQRRHRRVLRRTTLKADFAPGVLA